MAQLCSKEWKLSYEAIPTKSTASLVRLYDLFYKDKGDDDTSLTTWFSDVASGKGCNIGHDIICYNKKDIYGKSDGSMNDEMSRLSYTSWETSAIGTYGIDIAIPYYDRRSEPYTIKYEEGHLKNGKHIGDEVELTSYWPKSSNGDSEIVQLNQIKFSPFTLDKDDVIPYRDVLAYSINGVKSTVCQYTAGRANLGAIGVLKDTSGSMSNISFSSIPFPTVGPYSSSNTSSLDIYLIGEDEAFTSNTLVLDKFKAYNYAFIDPDSCYGKELIYRALFSSYSLGAVEVNKFNTPAVFTENVKFYDSTSEIERYYYIKALKNTYVWVRAPFFGDYIKPESFQQELNTESSVKFKDLLLSDSNITLSKYDTTVGVGENKEDIKFIETDDSQDKTPYRPQTTPLFDSIAIAKGLGSVENENNKITYNNSDTTQRDTLLNTEVDFKGFPFSPRVNNQTVEGESSKSGLVDDSLAKTIPATVFFDDEYKNKVKYYDDARNPIVLPKSGNAYIDGRIMSPTIDEILYTIKELTSGRIADTTEQRTLGQIDSRPFNNTDQLTVDTVFDEAKYSDFKFFKSADDLKDKYQYDKNIAEGSANPGFEPLPVLGDPLHISYNNENGYAVDKWINQPKSITYPLYHELRELSERATRHENFENDVVKDFKEITNSFDSSLEEGPAIYEHPKRSIENMAAWLTNDLDGCNKIFDKTRKEDDNVTENKNVLPVDSKIYYNDRGYGVFWGPRPAPYSLRELEALAKGLKYNLLSMFRFIVENFTVSGGLGISNKETLGENNEFSHHAGSLYQMHKDFNFQKDTPNTYFKRNGIGDFVTGKAATFDDETNFDSKHAEEKNHRGDYNKNNYYPLEKDYGWGENNGLSPNQLEYSSADVYMAADGTWRYIFDNVRMPILKSDY